HHERVDDAAEDRERPAGPDERQPRHDVDLDRDQGEPEQDEHDGDEEFHDGGGQEAMAENTADAGIRYTAPGSGRTSTRLPRTWTTSTGSPAATNVLCETTSTRRPPISAVPDGRSVVSATPVSPSSVSSVSAAV